MNSVGDHLSQPDGLKVVIEAEPAGKSGSELWPGPSIPSHLTSRAVAAAAGEIHLRFTCAHSTFWGVGRTEMVLSVPGCR